MSLSVSHTNRAGKDNVFLRTGEKSIDDCQRPREKKATITREISRNQSGEDYIPALAQEYYHERRKKCRPHKKLDSRNLRTIVKDKFIHHQCSPEEITG